MVRHLRIMRFGDEKKVRANEKGRRRMIAHTYNIHTLFCNVKSLRAVRVVIAASEKLAQDRIISAK
jgi:hypothetical protein